MLALKAVLYQKPVDDKSSTSSASDKEPDPVKTDKANYFAVFGTKQGMIVAAKSFLCEDVEQLMTRTAEKNLNSWVEIPKNFMDLYGYDNQIEKQGKTMPCKFVFGSVTD